MEAPLGSYIELEKQFLQLVAKRAGSSGCENRAQGVELSSALPELVGPNEENVGAPLGKRELGQSHLKESFKKIT